MAGLIVILGSIGIIAYFIYDFIRFDKLLKEDEARWAERIAHINRYIKEKRKELEKLETGHAERHGTGTLLNCSVETGTPDSTITTSGQLPENRRTA